MFLSAEEALDLLQRTDALKQLRSSAYQVTEFSALILPTEPTAQEVSEGTAAMIS